ncbi:hypothetical protein SBADM41S_05335 [Streptomyces badius]
MHHPIADSAAADSADLTLTLTKHQLMDVLGGPGLDGIEHTGDLGAFVSVDDPDPGSPSSRPDGVPPTSSGRLEQGAEGRHVGFDGGDFGGVGRAGAPSPRGCLLGVGLGSVSAPVAARLWFPASVGRVSSFVAA